MGHTLLLNLQMCLLQHCSMVRSLSLLSSVAVRSIGVCLGVQLLQNRFRNNATLLHDLTDDCKCIRRLIARYDRLNRKPYKALGERAICPQ